MEAPCDARSAAQKAVAELGEAYFQKAPPTAFKRTIAVLPIKVPADLEHGGVADSVAAFVHEKLALSTAFVLVERSNMDAILSEIESGLSGLADPTKAAKAGELLGAELLVQVSLSEVGDGLVLALEIVDTSTGQIVVSVTRSMDRADVVASGNEYLRSSFQSQYGLSVYGSAGVAWATTPVWVPSFVSGGGSISHTGQLSMVSDGGVSYKPLSWLCLDRGFLVLYTPQFYLSEDGKVESPLAIGTRSVRYTEFSGSGLSLGASAI
ncbi:MAG TPA: CsgG/HfaB family protein [bacterium]|nr:CsgG/HfaB family protein [bacterium]